MRRLVMILGDQLNTAISSLNGFDPSQDQILMCEVLGEATYVPHHQKKIAFIFSAMRHFAAELRAKGAQVRYYDIDDPESGGTFSEALRRTVGLLAPQEVWVMHPGELRVLQDLQRCAETNDFSLTVTEDQRFLCSTAQFAQWAQGRKQLRMEDLYRILRKQYGILMDGDKPIGGAWNYDQSNRKKAPKGLVIPPPFQSTNDAITKEVLEVVARRFSGHYGDLHPFHFAVNRTDALRVLAHFIEERLPNFGDYQDAMVSGEPWMFHSHISFYLNCGLLNPRECIDAAEAAYHTQHAPLNAVEGFIRQILGWREYVRGVYWLMMPDYASRNTFNADRALPQFYWDGETDMNCLSQCAKETKSHAYAHHIQRLMVLGNFALLAGIHPDEVNEWYLAVYADAYEWVELPNVSGMVLYADGGFLASKPYAASGAYINKMSDYCKGCHYQVKEKSGASACPFNYLYWDFLDRNYSQLESNFRLKMPYRTFGKFSPDRKAEIRADSAVFFKKLEEGSRV